jgi:Zn ribbon nucleic-acid-binding protein
MKPIPPSIKAFATCPVCEARVELTHWDGENFDLRPVEVHIVKTHPELKGNREHVPNIRVQWFQKNTGATDQ